MFDAMVRLLGISRRPRPPARPTPASPPGQRSPRKEGAQAQQSTRLAKATHAQKAGAPVSGRTEPAMAVIPKDDGQMPPRAAAPGLPPVDPVTRPAARQVSPPPSSTSASSSPSDAGSLPAGDRIPGLGLGDSVQGGLRSCAAPKISPVGMPDVRHGVTGEREADPLRRPSIGHEQNSIPPRRAAHPGADNGPVRDPNQGELFPELSAGYEHSMEAAAKDCAVNPCIGSAKSIPDATAPSIVEVEPQSLALDSRTESGFSRASRPAERSPRVPRGSSSVREQRSGPMTSC